MHVYLSFTPFSPFLSTLLCPSSSDSVLLSISLWHLRLFKPQLFSLKVFSTAHLSQLLSFVLFDIVLLFCVTLLIFTALSPHVMSSFVISSSSCLISLLYYPVFLYFSHFFWGSKFCLDLEEKQLRKTIKQWGPFSSFWTYCIIFINGLEFVQLWKDL